MKRSLLILAWSVCSPLFAESWYTDNAFFGEDRCVVVGRDRELKAGEPIVVLGKGGPVAFSTVTAVDDAHAYKKQFDELGWDKVYNNKPLYQEIGCFWGLRGYGDKFKIAKIGKAGEPIRVDFAFRKWPAAGVAVAGEPAELSKEQIRKYWSVVASTLPKMNPETLYSKGFRYGPVNGHEMTELYFGMPTLAKDQTLDSIKIWTLVLHNGVVVHRRDFARAKDDPEERVDTPNYELNPQDWWKTLDETVGFLSLDGGKNWDIATRNVGFEGINYTIEGLTGPAASDNSYCPRCKYSDSIYTYH